MTRRDNVARLAEHFGGWEALARVLHGVVTGKNLTDAQLGELGGARVTDLQIRALKPKRNGYAFFGNVTLKQQMTFEWWCLAKDLFRKYRPDSVSDTDAFYKILRRHGTALGYTGVERNIDKEIKSLRNRLGEHTNRKPFLKSARDNDQQAEDLAYQFGDEPDDDRLLD